MFDSSQFTPWVLFTDMGIIFALMLVAKFLRVKIKLIQQLFIPPSLIAGILGLALGSNGLGWLPLSNNLGTYAAVMIALVFGALPLSSPKVSMKEVTHHVGPIWIYAQLGMLLQWTIMGVFGIYVLKLIWPQLNDAFGIMLPAGFYGGHGTAAALGSAFENLGWDEARSLAMTTATVGIIFAIIGGLIIVKIAARKKQTSFIADFNELPNELRSGLVPLDKRESAGQSTTSAISIDSLTFHMSFVFVAAMLGYLLSCGVKQAYPKLELPVFSCAFIIGLLMKKIFDRTKVSDYICTQTTQRISSFFTDLLVACGVASIKLGVVIKYATPLIVLILVGVAVTLFITFFLGKKILKTYWFERSIFAWGWWTGTMAMGIALLRIVDPKMQSKTMDDYALAYLPIAPVEILLITFVPVMFMNGMGIWLMCICLLFALLLLALWWWMKKKEIK
jgi:Na+/glutamate symporter